MTDIGAILRAAREDQGLTLADVEARTRIRTRILEGLENNEFDLVRGDPHLRGFLRNYALFLGLEARPILDSLGIRSQPLPQSRREAREARYLAEPLQSNPVPWGRILFTLGVLLLLGLAALYLWGPPTIRETLLAQIDRANGIAAVPTTTITPIVPATSAPATTDSSNVITRTVTQTTTIIEPFRSPTPSEEVATAVPTATLPPRTPTPDRDATATAEASITPIVYEGIVLQAQFTEDSYIYLQVDQNPDLIFDGVLPTGHNAEWTANEEIYITIGNAGGVNVVLNGEDLGVLGEAGEVVEVTWRVDPDGGPPIEVPIE
jgi:cytoskeleton protein RodZ